MIALTALVIGVLTGTGTYLLLKRDIIRMTAGVVLLSNSAIVFIISAGFGEREAPILPVLSAARVSDPLVQSLALTAIVIGFGITALLLKVGLAVERSHRTIDVEDIARAEREEEARIEPEAS